MVSRKALIALAAVAVVVLPTAASCTSHQGLAAPAPGSSTSASLPVAGSAPVPPGSAPATEFGPRKTAAFPVDSGATVGADSATPHATYKARITVTVTARHDAVSSASSTATELEVAHIKIQVQSGTFPHGDEDFKYLSADGNVYPPITAAGVGNALQSGDVKAGRSAEGDVVFRVPFGGGLVQIYGSSGPSAAWRSTSTT